MQISVIILAKKNTSQLKAAVHSVSGADEVLIISNKKITNFAQARNRAMKMAKYDWILFLDSDEVLEDIVETKNQDSGKDTIKRLKQEMAEALKSDPDITSFSVTRSDVFWGKKLNFGEAGKQNLVRIVNRNQQKFVGKVHEVAIGAGKNYKLNLIITHHAHENINSFMEKIIGYAKLASEKDESYLIILGKLLFYPKLKFFVNYFLKLGFLDGWRGLIYAVIMSLHSLLVRIFQLENKFKPKKSNVL